MTDPMDRKLDWLMRFSPPKSGLTVHTNIDTFCAATFLRINKGVLVSDILTETTSSPQDTFQLGFRYVDERFADLYKWFIGAKVVGNIWLTETETFKPMISRESAEKDGRPCYRDLIMDAEIGERVLAVLCKTDKRRFWDKAEISTIGDRFRMFVHDDTHPRHVKACMVTVDIYKLRDVILAFEELYETQMKASIVEGIMKMESPQELMLSSSLVKYRGTMEFQVATLVSQKKPVKATENEDGEAEEVITKPKKERKSKTKSKL